MNPPIVTQTISLLQPVRLSRRLFLPHRSRMVLASLGTQKGLSVAVVVMAGADEYRCDYCRILYPGDVCDLHTRLSERDRMHHIIFVAKLKTLPSHRSPTAPSSPSGFILLALHCCIWLIPKPEKAFRSDCWYVLLVSPLLLSCRTLNPFHRIDVPVSSPFGGDGWFVRVDNLEDVVGGHIVLAALCILGGLWHIATTPWVWTRRTFVKLHKRRYLR